MCNFSFISEKNLDINMNGIRDCHRGMISKMEQLLKVNRYIVFV